MLKKIRFYALVALTFVRKNFRLVGRWILLAAFIGILFSLTRSSFWDPLLKQTSKFFTRATYSEGFVGSVKTLNPLFETSEAEKEINYLVYRGLVRMNEKGIIEPDLAQTFKQISDTEYLFKLKKNEHWQDGEPFTADDVVYTIETAKSSSLSSTARQSFKDVSVEKIDDFTVRLRLKEAFAPFLAQTTLGIIPRHISLSKYKPIGTGEFQVANFSTGKVTLTNGKIDLVFKFYPSKAKAILALKQGEIKSIAGLSKFDLVELRDYPNYRTYAKTLQGQIVTAFFNTRDEILSDKNVRQALAYATNKEAIVQKLGAASKIAVGPLSLVNPLGLAVEKEWFTLNSAKAASLLEGAGWKLAGGVRLKDGKKLTLTLTTLDEPEFSSVAQQIKKNWEALGINFQTITLDSTSLSKAIKNTQFQVVLTTVEVNPDPDQYVLWHSTQKGEGNVTALSSPKVDKLLEDARKTSDLGTRKGRYEEFERILADESPAIFLYYPSYNWVVNKKFENIKIDRFAVPVDRFQNVKNWKIQFSLF